MSTTKLFVKVQKCIRINGIATTYIKRCKWRRKASMIVQGNAIHNLGIVMLYKLSFWCALCWEVLLWYDTRQDTNRNIYPYRFCLEQRIALFISLGCAVCIHVPCIGVIHKTKANVIGTSFIGLNVLVAVFSGFPSSKTLVNGAIGKCLKSINGKLITLCV
ncbi:Uncharacterised protein [Chlamydia trachomatis]|nr:Uncharacterised protein [Chlamydia trachomatis]